MTFQYLFFLFWINRWPIVNCKWVLFRQSSGAVLACSVTLKIAGEYLAMVLYLQSKITILLYKRWFAIVFLQALFVNFFLSQIIKG